MAGFLEDWYRHVACLGVDLNKFFDDYEVDTETAIETDTMCKSCPVRQTCLIEGVKTDSTGVFGGVYLSAGNYSKQRNKHKTKSDSKNLQSEVTRIKTYLKENPNV